MKVNAEALGDMMCVVMYKAMEEDLCNTDYGNVDMLDFDKAQCALTIRRALANKQKRIVIDIKYEKTIK